MDPAQVNSRSDRRTWRLTRRSLLRMGLATAFGAVVWPARGQSPFEIAASRSAVPSTQPSPLPNRGEPAAMPWWLRESEKTRVVQVRAEDTLNGSVPDPYVLSDLIGQGVQALVQHTSPGRAWREILGKAQRIAVIFDRTAAKLLNTTDAMARVLVQQLEAAGYHPRTVALVHAPSYLARALGSRPPEIGWGGGFRLAGEQQELANYLLEADAVINVPFLLAHPIRGMSCGINTLATSVLRQPGRYYDALGDEVLPQVVLRQEVSEKLRLTIVNAVRLAIRGGADATENDVVGWGGLLLGQDPVAVDTKALDLLLRQRRLAGETVYDNVPYLQKACEIGLGRWQSNDVDHVVLSWQS